MYRIYWQFAGPFGRWHDLAEERRFGDALNTAARILAETRAEGHTRDRVCVRDSAGHEWPITDTSKQEGKFEQVTAGDEA